MNTKQTTSTTKTKKIDKVFEALENNKYYNNKSVKVKHLIFKIK